MAVPHITVIGIVLYYFSFSVVHGQSDHTLYLYDGPLSSPEPGLILNNYVDNLQNFAFNDLSSSFCVVRGIWLFYENPDFNSNFLGLSAYYWGENYCQDLPLQLNNQISSVRYAGSPFGFQYDALNIYQIEWFQSYEVFTSADILEIASPYSGSLIITGRSTWTLYELQNFMGYSVCVTPADPTYAYPGFFTSASEFGFSGKLIRSARKGCWTNKVMRPILHVPGNQFNKTQDNLNKHRVTITKQLDMFPCTKSLGELFFYEIMMRMRMLQRMPPRAKPRSTTLTKDQCYEASTSSSLSAQISASSFNNQKIWAAHYRYP